MIHRNKDRKNGEKNRKEFKFHMQPSVEFNSGINTNKNNRKHLNAHI